MGWLDEMTVRLRYDCEDGHRTLYVCKASEEIDYDAKIDCAECGRPASYAGVEPQKVNLVSKVAYEQNGRKAYAITSGSGTVTYMSQTKYDYLQSGGTVKPAYTREYEQKLIDEGNAGDLEARDLTKMKRRPKGGAKEVYSKMLQQDEAKVRKGEAP